MEPNNNQTLTASKDLSASAETVYKAWTDPEQLKQWWRPLGNQLISVTNEVALGGKIEYRFKNQDQENLLIRGEYLEVIPNEKLVYTWNWELPDDGVSNSQYKLTVNFRPSGERSTIEVSQENTSAQEPVHPHQHGWDEGLNHLDEFLSSQGPEEKRQEASSGTGQSGVPDYG